MVVAVLAGVLGAAEVLVATRSPGPGLDPDSASYLGAAESLAHGHGLTIPMADWSDPEPTSSLSHFPPGFSVAIAAGVKAGAPATQSARLIETLSFALTVAIMTYIVGSTVGTLAAVLVALSVMLARPIVLVHVSILSEPLFLCALAATLLGVLRRWHPLAIGTVAVAAALVRYAGVALVGAVVLWHLFEPGPIRRRLARASAALLPTLVFYGAWVLHTRAENGATAIRQFGIYGNLSEAFAQGGRTIAAWLVPTTDPPTTVQLWIGSAAALIVALVTSVGTRKAASSRDDAWRALVACALMMCCYAGVLVASRLTADANIPFDERILAPFILLATIGVSLAVGRAWHGWGLLLRGSLVSLFAVWLNELRLRFRRRGLARLGAAALGPRPGRVDSDLLELAGGDLLSRAQAGVGASRYARRRGAADVRRHVGPPRRGGRRLRRVQPGLRSARQRGGDCQSSDDRAFRRRDRLRSGDPHHGALSSRPTSILPSARGRAKKLA
jgi:hypothetical protein